MYTKKIEYDLGKGKGKMGKLSLPTNFSLKRKTKPQKLLYSSPLEDI